MEITRSRPDSEPGPAERFTGTVWLDELASPAPPARMRAYSVHFTPGARTAWHRHPFGQVLYVMEGEGRTQREGGPVEILRAGDTVHIDPGERHWHGAGPSTFMTHLAMQEADENGSEAEWEQLVTDAEYGAPAVA